MLAYAVPYSHQAWNCTRLWGRVAATLKEQRLRHSLETWQRLMERVAWMHSSPEHAREKKKRTEEIEPWPKWERSHCIGMSFPTTSRNPAKLAECGNPARMQHTFPWWCVSTRPCNDSLLTKERAILWIRVKPLTFCYCFKTLNDPKAVQQATVLCCALCGARARGFSLVGSHET